MPVHWRVSLSIGSTEKEISGAFTVSGTCFVEEEAHRLEVLRRARRKMQHRVAVGVQITDFGARGLPVADAEVRLNIRGTPFRLNGVGGRDKNWNPRPWAVISQNWDMARAIVGPYSLMLWNYASAVDGKSYFSATVTKGDKVLFRTSKRESSCGTESYGSFKLTTTGPVHLSSPPGSKNPLLESRHTGYLIDLVSPQSDEHWRFNIDFSQTTFWFRASETLNVGQFAGITSGGLVGGKVYKGVSTGSVQELVL
ncbi:hypothetical protein Daus18300_010025 [Diaporthe australafricana]|uniref:Diels-Alderase C-terminal domain-containing protein n=1 Tax=Diaporthe australafricana TaxID=127596 RepID=A0ABR3WCJ8_9PEZI